MTIQVKCHTLFNHDHPNQPIHNFSMFERDHTLVTAHLESKGLNFVDPNNSLITILEQSKRIKSDNGRITYKNLFMRDISEDDLTKAIEIVSDNSSSVKQQAVLLIMPFLDEILANAPAHHPSHRKLDRLAKGSLFKQKIDLRYAIEIAAFDSEYHLRVLSNNEYTLYSDNRSGTQKISNTGSCYFLLIEEALLLATISIIKNKPFNSLVELYRE